ncbi:hypothetical protein DERP_009243 [Dermatophagoides pteronyssinus]|uniref:Uncharacterized protein n=1 Tax=Dermatophagoides pteronyssinus TaxID=6956 RepID=A0ABQ8JQY1_DERPT|nr:hypothetical protein DERP_009243 [Dermatophagoides pteronyssinus]
MKSIQILSTILMMAIILIDSIQSTQNDWEPILRPNLSLTRIGKIIWNAYEEYDLNSGNKYSDFMNYCMEECLQLHSSQRPN